MRKKYRIRLKLFKKFGGFDARSEKFIRSLEKKKIFPRTGIEHTPPTPDQALNA